MLFILLVSSIGMPLITHSCSHDNQKDIHLFSSEHHCKDKCNANTITDESLAISESPCCSFETSFITNDNFFSSKTNVTNKQLLTLSTLLKADIVIESSSVNLFVCSSNSYKKYGYKYRIALQSFLC